jgi:hypothetical protein
MTMIGRTLHFASGAPIALTGMRGQRNRPLFRTTGVGLKLGEQTVARCSPEQEVRFFDVEYPIPAGLIADKEKITVRFEATNTRSTPSVFGNRIIRSDMEH